MSNIIANDGNYRIVKNNGNYFVQNKNSFVPGNGTVEMAYRNSQKPITEQQAVARNSQQTIQNLYDTTIVPTPPKKTWPTTGKERGGKRKSRRSHKRNTRKSRKTNKRRHRK